MAPFGFGGYNGGVRTAAALAVALGAVVVATADAAPKPGVERARSQGVAAIFSYAVGEPGGAGFSRLRLVIRRHGVTRFSARLRRAPSPGGQAQPANYFERRRSVSVRDLDGDGEPEVVLDLYWGGAHCCWYTQLYRWLPRAGTYRALVHVWGNVRYRLADLVHDGLPELVTLDDRFSYAFASFADSRWPLRILDYRRGALRIVTRAFPRQIERDASALWREATTGRGRRENYGILAAWAADQCLLGHGSKALQTLERLRRRGRLQGTAERPRAYLAHLRRFLRRTGYLY
jgi:hypothetical protein